MTDTIKRPRKPQPLKIECSFCGAPQRQVKKLIAGPRVYICDECVEICVDVLVDEKAKAQLVALGERTDVLGALRADLETVRSEERKLRHALKLAGRAIADAVGVTSISCMWCGVLLPSEGEARDHVGTCDKHPAVIKLAELSAERDGGRP